MASRPRFRVCRGTCRNSTFAVQAVLIAKHAPRSTLIALLCALALIGCGGAPEEDAQLKQIKERAFTITETTDGEESQPIEVGCRRLREAATPIGGRRQFSYGCELRYRRGQYGRCELGPQISTDCRFQGVPFVDE